MLSKLVNNISKLSVDSLAQKVLKESGLSRFILDLNRNEQLFKEGVGVDGEVVGYYSLLTSLINPSKKFNQPYNFKDTGKMFKSFKVNADSDGFTIDADVDKLINGKYQIIENDKQILGLTDESKIKLVQKIIPFADKEVRKQIFG